MYVFIVSTFVNNQYNSETKVVFLLSRLAGPTSQFLNGTHEFSELVLARMDLVRDQSRSVLPLRSAKTQ